MVAVADVVFGVGCEGGVVVGRGQGKAPSYPTRIYVRNW